MIHVHDEGPSHNQAFAWGIALNISFVLLEAVVGTFIGSLALVADAAHNLSDVLGLLLAWGAGRLATRRPTERRTYGFRRSTVLASLANAIVLLVAVGGILWEAVHRFGTPHTVEGNLVMAVAGAGVLVNGGTALLFMAGRKHDLNIRGAFLHMAADAAVSVGVVVAGLVITLTGWDWLDPTISVAIALVIVVGTWGLLRQSLDLALDAVPEGIDPGLVRAFLGSLPGVTTVHDLHIWGMSTTHVALTAHLVKPDVANDDAFLTQACNELHDRFGIEHATLQVERDASHFCSMVGEDPAPSKPDSEGPHS